MALNKIEQLQMIKDINPPSGYSFLSLIHQTGVDIAKDWYNTIKNTESDGLATSYKNKYGQVITRILQADNATLRSIKQMLVSILGDTAVTLAAVQAADDNAWMTFTEANIVQAIEYVAGINTLEKTAYTAIV